MLNMKGLKDALYSFINKANKLNSLFEANFIEVEFGLHFDFE
jgi:hypothetical protein